LPCLALPCLALPCLALPCLALPSHARPRRGRVFKHLTEWFEEFRLYHRKDGRVFKEGDDLLSATRYALMMIRYAENTLPRPRRRDHVSGGGHWMAM
jgi:hypothetical protein